MKEALKVLIPKFIPNDKKAQATKEDVTKEENKNKEKEEEEEKEEEI